MVYFHTDYLQVEHHKEANVLITQWYSGCSSLQYRQALIQVIRIIKELDVTYAVLDRRLLHPISADDLNWTNTVYAKACTRLPLKKIAVISSFNQETERQQKQLYVQLQSFTEMRTFDDLTSAYDWLTTVPA